MIARQPLDKRATAGRMASVAQAVLVLSLGLMALAPPERGSVLLIPLSGAAARQLDGLITRSNATVTGIGFLPRSRFVEGSRSELVPLMMPHGILVLAGAPPFCGAVEGNGGR